MQNYVFALRACLKEMEADDSDEYALQEKLAYLTHDLVSHCTGSASLVAWCRAAKDHTHHDTELD